MRPWLWLTLRRIAWLPPTILALLLLTFIVAHVIPADPAGIAAGETATAAQVDAVRTRLGLDQPLPVQFVAYLGRVARADLGISLFTGRPIARDLMARLPATLELTLLALAFAVLGGVPLGVLAGHWHGSGADHAIRLATVAGFAVAGFWLALMLQMLFAMELGWLPLAGRGEGGLPDRLRHAVLPAIALGLPVLATLVRFARAGILDALASPAFAWQTAMGVPARVRLWRYALRHALVAVVTQTGLAFGAMLAGSVVIETVFNWPGVGSFAYNSITHADYPAVMGFVLWSGIAFVLVNLVIDLLLMLVDPRERLA